MPLYEYQCGSCGERFERIRKFSDAPLEVCPNCGGPLRKLVSSPAFHLKGSGWYATDYAKKSGEPAASGSEKPPSSGKDDKAAPATSNDTSKPATAAAPSTSTDAASKPSTTPASTKES